MIYAPVIIPTLCRFEHFKRCIESLSHCTGAEYTEVYIGLDYPAKDAHWKGYNKIKDYLENCGNLGFKELYVVKRPHNYGFGPNGNYTLLKKYVWSKYDRLISSEDDNEFSPCFLDYMNKGLELYKEDDSILSISGYNYPIDMSGYKSNIYYSKNFSAWGCGLWKHKDYLFQQFYDEYTPNKLLHSNILKKILKEDWKKISPLFIMYKKNVQWGDVYREMYSIYSMKYNIFPTITKVKNWGHDGSGEHCGKSNQSIYLTQKMDQNPFFDYTPVIKRIDNTLIERINKFKKWPLRNYLRVLYYGIIFLYVDFKSKFHNENLSH